MVLLPSPTSGIGSVTLTRLLTHPSHPTLVLLAYRRAGHGGAQGPWRGLVAHGIRVDLSDQSSVGEATGSVAELLGHGVVRELDAVVRTVVPQWLAARVALHPPGAPRP